MATWVFTLSPGGVATTLVDVMSIVRTRRLFSELKPNTNRLEFRCRFDSTLFATLLANDTVSITVTKDAAAYFTGYLSPNYKTSIRDGQKYIDLVAEDANIQVLGKTIGDIYSWAGYAVCTPSATATSLVHAIATAAGVTLASGTPTITTVIPYVVVLSDDKETWAGLLERILFEYRHTYYFNEAGQLVVDAMINDGTVTTTGTLTTAAGSANIRGELQIEKSPEKYDDIRVKYNLIEQKTGIVLFQDTTGGTETQSATIPLAAVGDSGGKDYYPLSANIGEVFSKWKSPEGYEIYIATSAALDAAYESGITLSTALVNYFRQASFAYRNTAAAIKNITKLRIVGNAYIIASRNVARSTGGTGKKLLEHEAKFVFSTVSAQALARALAQYYAYSDIKYTAKSKTAYTIGQYVLVQDAIYSGLSIKTRVIGIIDAAASDGLYEYSLEAVADFVSIALEVEGETSNVPAVVGSADILAMPRISCTSPLVYMTTSGDYDPDEVTFSALRADGTAYSGFWKIWRGGVLGHANTVAAATITVPSELPVADDSVIYETTPFGPVFRAELYADAGYVTRLDTYNTSILPNVLEKSQSLAYAEAEVARLTAEAYADGIVTAEESRAIADAVARRDEAITVASEDATAKANAAEAAANAAVVTYTPRYLGKATSAPTANAIGDCYTKYSVTAGAANRGVFIWDGSAWVRTEERKYIMQALADISYIIAYKDQSDPPEAIYGTASDYTSDSTTQTDFAFFQAAVIGYVEANDLLVRKTFRVGGRYDTAGAVVDDTAAGFYMGASGACKSAGVEFEGTLGGGVQWGGPSLIGTALSISGAIVPSLAALNGTDVAFIDSGNDELRVYRWSGTSWSMVGSGLAISGSGYPSLAALNGTDVAFIDSSNEQLRTYRWSGSSWSLLGSGFSLPNTEYAALCALNGTDVAFINSYHNLLRVFRWSGSSWSSVGSSLSISGSGYPSLAALNGTDVAFIDSSNDELRTYRWSGSNWNIVGSGLAISATGVPALSSLNGSDVAFVDSINDALRVYRWSGSDWSAVPDAGKLTIGGGSPALASLNGTDVAFIDSVNDTLRLYRFQFSLSRPYSRKLTG